MSENSFKDKNVLGGQLLDCSTNPITGFFRDGCCRTDEQDIGQHVVCAEITDDFLEFSKSRGNDLSAPVPEIDFPGLKSGDRWCICALRWQEALEAGRAPQIYLQSTHESALEVLSLEDLKKYAIDLL